LNNSRINNKWPLAREGIPFLLIGIALALALFFLGFLLASIFMGLVSLFIAFFFRDPDRNGIINHNEVFAPADGTILEILDIESDDNPLGRRAKKVSIFMSLFNVHVNRIPLGGTIKDIAYHPGKFHSANLDKASQYNERNTIIMQTHDSREIAFIQIAGLIARRIVCWVKRGDPVEPGQRFGLIRFGSRLDIFLPSKSQIMVKPRQKVRAGETIIGRLS
jgi:phosphatidylserine decarboxylase